MLHSAACTLANKLKLRSRSKVFKKYGGDLAMYITPMKKISFEIHRNLKRINKFNTTVVNKLPYDIFTYNLKTKGNLLD